MANRRLCLTLHLFHKEVHGYMNSEFKRDNFHKHMEFYIPTLLATLTIFVPNFADKAKKQKTIGGLMYPRWDALRIRFGGSD